MGGGVGGMKGKTFLENRWLLDPRKLCSLAIVSVVLGHSPLCEVYEVSQYYLTLLSLSPRICITVSNIACLWSRCNMPGAVFSVLRRIYFFYHFITVYMLSGSKNCTSRTLSPNGNQRTLNFCILEAGNISLKIKIVVPPHLGGKP